MEKRMVNLEPLQDIIINKHIAAIHCTPLKTKGHEDCLNAAIAVMQAYARDNNIDILDIPREGIRVKKEDFHAMLPVGLGEHSDRVSSILMDLSKFSIEWNLWGQDKTRSWSITPFFKEVKEGDTDYTFYWNDRLFFNAFVRPKIYARMGHQELSSRMKMSSRFGARLYEFGLGALATMQAEEYTTEYIPVDLVRLNIFDSDPNKNKDWSNFSRRVFEPALESVNKETDMTVSADFARYRNKISSISFTFKRKDTARQISLFDGKTEPLSPGQAVLVDRLREEGVNPPSTALMLVRDYEEGYVTFVLNELNKRRSSIRSPGAWLNKVITQDVLRKDYNSYLLDKSHVSNISALEAKISKLEAELSSIDGLYNSFIEGCMERFYDEVAPDVVAEYENDYYKSLGSVERELVRKYKGKAQPGYKNKSFYRFLCGVGGKDKKMGAEFGMLFISLEVYAEKHLSTGLHSLRERLEDLKRVRDTQQAA
jgi:hypothetical protein